MDNLIDPARGNPNVLGYPVLTQPKWLQEFFQEDLSRVDRRQFLQIHFSSLARERSLTVAVPLGHLVVIGDFDIVSVARVPPKTYPPLAVDSETVLPGPIPSKFLQPVSRWNSQIGQFFGSIKDQESTRCRTLNLR